ncbi:MAG: hypothetical protein IH991_11950 [Planctomycetes bacterium]|nr:hypothetical protein [Planctomycetota bacterium]
MVTITPRRRAAVNFSELAAAVKRAGFTPDRMTLAAVGRIEQDGDTSYFRIRGWGNAYPLRNNRPTSEKDVNVLAVVDYATKPLRMALMERVKD